MPVHKGDVLFKRMEPGFAYVLYEYAHKMVLGIYVHEDWYKKNKQIG